MKPQFGDVVHMISDSKWVCMVVSRDPVKGVWLIALADPDHIAEPMYQKGSVFRWSVGDQFWVKIK